MRRTSQPTPALMRRRQPQARAGIRFAFALFSSRQVCSLLALLSVVGISIANSAESQSCDACGPLLGSYEIVGRYPDSSRTYSGTISLYPDGNALRVERQVSGRKTHGIGRIEYRTGDNIPVLLLEYPGLKHGLEMWCRWGFDLDNYARITCLSRWQGKNAKQNGMEALFYREPDAQDSARPGTVDAGR